MKLEDLHIGQRITYSYPPGCIRHGAVLGINWIISRNDHNVFCNMDRKDQDPERIVVNLTFLVPEGDEPFIPKNAPI